MTKTIKFMLRCPECHETFQCDMTAPEKCPLCKFSPEAIADDVVCLPNVLSMRTKSIESVARGVMDGSEKRIDAAMELAGGVRSDYDALKITNLNDGRHSEFATKDVSNPVTDVMKAAPGITGFQPNGSAFAANTSVGPYARAGANIVTRLSTSHGQRVQTLATSGKTR